jgi:hypothetical protein
MLAPFPCLADYPINEFGCDTHSPFDPWTPPEDPSYAVLCQTGGGGCPAANPPEILSHDSTEATLRATVPANFYPNRVMWRVEAGPNMDALWQYNSQEGLPIKGYWEPGDVVAFGAPGLLPNTAHRFEVAFCDPSLCLCWSWPSATITTDSVHDLGLSAPAGLDTTMEDLFDRPDTSGRDVDGDGLGPPEAWQDFTGEQQGASSPVVDDQSGKFLPSSFAEYAALQSAYPHTFADAKVRVDLHNVATIKFNFQVVGRIVQPPPDRQHYSGRLYAAKLVKGIRNCLDPTIFAVWFAEDPMDPANEYAKASCRPDPLHPGHSIPYDPSAGFECAEMPPLETEDPALPGSYLSNPVWLRLEVNDEDPSRETVRIVATAAWDCVDGQPIENCAHKCTFTRIDGNNPVHQMYGATGRWGVGFHDKTYRLDYFKAGEGP